MSSSARLGCVFLKKSLMMFVATQPAVHKQSDLHTLISKILMCKIVVEFYRYLYFYIPENICTFHLQVKYSDICNHANYCYIASINLHGWKIWGSLRINSVAISDTANNQLFGACVCLWVLCIFAAKVCCFTPNTESGNWRRFSE